MKTQDNKVVLGQWPTPLAKLDNLSRHLGVAIEIKRDDLSGLAFGGNKTRKLEPILAEALAQDCDVVITAGATQSNHCRQTAAAAAMLGLECHLVLAGQADDFPVKQGNLLLDHLFGCTIHWSGDNRKGEDIPALKQQLITQGKRPYVVPYGGSNALGASAYVLAMQELASQRDSQPAYTHIIFASSSGGTHAGVALGNVLYPQSKNVVGVYIDKAESTDSFCQHILSLSDQAAQHMGVPDRLELNQIGLNSDYLGEGYGVLGNAEREAIALMASQEGILLDPVYSGRAFSGLLGMIRQGQIAKDDRVLFWHTGGSPALFAYADQL